MINFKTRLTLATLTAALFCISAPARAEFHSVPLGFLTADIRTYSGGDLYPVAPATIDVGGVPFDLVEYFAQPNSLGALQLYGPGEFQFLDTDVPHARTVYTLINSAFGQVGAINGTVQFFGVGGSFASFHLVQGVNIRDHFNNGYNNTATDVYPNEYTGAGGTVRLDRQRFDLPPEFAHDTLDYVFFHAGDFGQTGVPQGQPFLTAVTVSDTPEPASIALLAIGLLVIPRRRRHHSSTHYYWPPT